MYSVLKVMSEANFLEGKSLESLLAIVGEEDVVMGYGALGFKVYTAKEKGEYPSILQEVLHQKSAICLVQDTVYNAVRDLIESYRHLSVPIFIPLTKTAQSSLLDDMLKDIRLRATGTV